MLHAGLDLSRHRPDMAIDIGLHHVAISNRSNRPIHLEFTPRSRRVKADPEGPPEPVEFPMPSDWFEGELRRRWLPIMGTLRGERSLSRMRQVGPAS